MSAKGAFVKKGCQVVKTQGMTRPRTKTYLCGQGLQDLDIREAILCLELVPKEPVSE